MDEDEVLVNAYECSIHYVRGARPAFNTGTLERAFGDVVDDIHLFPHITTPDSKGCNITVEIKLHFFNPIPHKCSSSHFTTAQMWRWCLGGFSVDSAVNTVC